ncbi:hypothetical protein HYPSUDRAFT_587918 [Hypholoma sublateritium FD-334 SS-4]|uniref:N-acetyltransferase domain-containing protein n=1 Tax=Hypholoma sublateritium (strain FD-334 SS-4) TaxID=945553 RepID=A0A0D2NXE6_HYPSF|nr:hypothetical protein HYPSUDRAFT_587918 [Hypholoma sublateritium FD-334 SS-4]
MSKIKVVTISSPTEMQLSQMVKLAVAAFDDDLMTNAMTGGVRSLKFDLYRLLMRAAALEGNILAVQEEGTKNIVAIGVGFGPGVDFLGSEEQRALGANEFFRRLPEETKKWINDVNRPLSKKYVEDTIGQQTITDNWWIDCMATYENERGNGYGSAILRELCKMAAEQDKIVALNAITKDNVSFYQEQGFKVVGSAERPSPFGTWTSSMMVWNTPSSTSHM